MTILSPTIFSVTDDSRRLFLEISILASSVILLISLLAIRLLPILSYISLLFYIPMAPNIFRLLSLLDSRDLLLCTNGLHHLNFDTTTYNYTYPACSPFFHQANITLNETVSGNICQTSLPLYVNFIYQDQQEVRGCT